MISEGLLNTIIASGTTIAIGILTAVVAYKASIKGAAVQIQHEKEKLSQEAKKHSEYAKKAIERFIVHEVKSNFKKINSKLVISRLHEPTPFQHGFGNTSFSYDEFNRVKYELVKFESEDIVEVIKIYDLFYLLELKQDIQYLTQKEYEEFKEVYRILETKYT